MPNDMFVTKHPSEKKTHIKMSSDENLLKMFIKASQGRRIDI